MRSRVVVMGEEDEVEEEVSVEEGVEGGEDFEVVVGLAVEVEGAFVDAGEATIHIELRENTDSTYLVI